MKSPGATILFITRKWAPAVGGIETYSHRLAEQLRKIAPISVLALPGRDNGSPPTVLSLLWFGVQAFVGLLFCRRPPVAVHLGDMALWPLGLAARLRSGKTRIVLSAHGTDVAFPRRGGLRGRAYGIYLRLGARLLGSAKVIANSRATQNVAAETGWQCSEVVPLATDFSGPTPTGEHDGYLLFAGRLVERKGCGWFVTNVLPLLSNTMTLKVAGTPWDAGEWRAIDNVRVEFLGSLHGEELANAYRQALCVIVPNIEPKSGEYEGFGLVATEASAAGGVVLAARTGGLVEAVEEGITGMLIAPGVAEEWVTAIHEIAAWCVSQRRTFLMRSMERCREHYSWARVARQTYQAYDLE